MSDRNKLQFNVQAFNVSSLRRPDRSPMVLLEFRATRRSAMEAEIVELRLPLRGGARLLDDLALTLERLDALPES